MACIEDETNRLSAEGKGSAFGRQISWKSRIQVSTKSGEAQWMNISVSGTIGLYNGLRCLLTVEIIQLLSCRVDLQQGRVERPEQVLSLTAREQGLLRYLVERTGEVVTREELLTEVWGYAPTVISRAVDKTMGRLRKKLERDATCPDHLHTQYGVGFVFVECVPTTLWPSFSTRLVGRESDLAQVQQLISGGCRLLTILGVGGLGKSRLAIEVGRSLPGTVWLCDLAAATDQASLYAALGQALNIALVHGAPAQQLQAALQQRSGMLILDNAEQLIEPLRMLLIDWLQQTLNIVFLVTSRRRLDLTSEQILPLQTLSTEDAATLFRIQAAVVRSNVSVDPEVLQGILARLEGIPLAIELAASRMRTLSLHQLRERLDTDFNRVLRNRSRDRTPRHTTLWTLLDSSWSMLDEVEQRMFACCSIFASPFSLEAAEAILVDSDPDQVEELLERLLDHSLLVLIETCSGLRWQMLLFVRRYARPHLTEADHILERHARYFADWGDHIPTAVLPRLADEIADVHAACRWAIQHHNVPQAVAACRAVAHHYDIVGPFSIGLSLAEEVLSLPALTDHERVQMVVLTTNIKLDMGQLDNTHALEQALEWAGDTSALCSDVYTALGRCARHKMHSEVTIKWHQQALQHATRCGDGRRIARSQANIAPLLVESGQQADALSYHHAALSYFRRVGARREEAIVQGNLGRLSSWMGRYEDALSQFGKALSIHRECGDNQFISAIYMCIARVLRIQGEWEDSRSCAVTALKLSRQIGHCSSEANLLTDLSSTHTEVGRFEEALQFAQEALELYRKSHHRHGEAVLLCNIGNIYRKSGYIQKSQSLYHEALQIHQALDDQRFIGLTLGCLGEALLDEGKVEQAEVRLRESIDKLQEAKSTMVEGVFQGVLGVLLARRGEHDVSVIALDRAWSLLENTGAVLPQGRLLCQCAESALLRGEPDIARQAWSQAQALSKQIPLTPRSTLSTMLKALPF